LILTGCVSKHNPQISETEFDPQKRNWLKVYEQELKTAIENDDGEAYYFFWPEYLKEYDKQRYKAGVIKN
tara:strand:+ start:1278 stop:1487 length:210 start_codon:yes stop_codon:yes gene_type:complete